jgi:hypothetical protein
MKFASEPILGFAYGLAVIQSVENHFLVGTVKLKSKRVNVGHGTSLEISRH